MAALNLGETVALPVEQVAAAVGTLGENAAIAQTPMVNTAQATGLFFNNANNLNTILETLPSRVEALGKKAAGAYQPMRDLATAIGDAAKSAESAAGMVNALVLAISGLKDKTITITANVVANDPLGLLGGGGSNSTVPQGYQRNRPRARGGPVKKAEDYLVGEEGPEFFIPSENGTIIPANTTQSVMRALVALPQEEDEDKIPGYARGGRPKRKKPALVGEKGPELFIPDVAGTIIPADVTQAAIIAAGTMGDAFGGNRGQTPSERAKNRRRTDTTGGGTPSGPVVSGSAPQQAPPQATLGDAYRVRSWRANGPQGSAVPCSVRTCKSPA
jgi:hypothetical protein